MAPLSRSMRDYLRDMFCQPGAGAGRSSRAGGPLSGPRRDYHQPDSPLLCKLPAELRAQVFYELLGGHRVHVKIMPPPNRPPDRGNTRWRHGICQLPGIPFGPPGPLDDYYQCYYQCLSREGRQFVDLSILFTCRKAHVRLRLRLPVASPFPLPVADKARRHDEAVLVLYKTTTFILHAAAPSMSLPAYVRSFQCMTPRSWPHVSALELPWSLPWQDRPHYSAEAEQRYRKLWALLGDMPNLRHLRVAMFMPDCERDPNRRAEFRDLYLGPVQSLRGLRMCEIAVPFSYCTHFGVGDGEVFFDGGGDGGGGEGGAYRLVWMLDANARSEAIVSSMFAAPADAW